jgi:hypothetical protein
MLVDLAGQGPKTGQARITFDRDRVRDFEPEQKIRRNLLRQPLQITHRRELIVSGVDAHGLERLGVFRQAIPFKTRLGEATTIDIPAFLVELAAPPGVFPR